MSFTALLLALFLSNCAWAQTEVVIYYDNNYPPYSYLDKETKKAAGLYTEMIQLVFSKMPEYKLKLKPLPWKRGLTYLEEGKAFALFPPYFRPKERPYIHPYSLPLAEENTVIFCNKEKVKGPRKNYPEDFEGVRLTLIRGFELGRDNPLVKSGKIKVNEVGNNNQALSKVILGRSHCYVNDRITIEHALKNMKDKDKVEEKAVLKREFGFLGFSRKFQASWKDKVIHKYNETFYRLRQDGAIDRLLRKYTK